MTDTIVYAIRKFTREHHYCPTVRELADECDLSVAWLHVMLRRLRSDGLVSWVDGQARTLHVPPEGGKPIAHSE